MTDFTLLIKTIMRPVKLERLILSARESYPKLPIIVADDGPKEMHLKPGDQRRLGIRYRTYYFDIGIGTCYNDALTHVDTPYTIICDDDNRFIEQTQLPLWKPFLKDGAFDLLGGAVRRTRGGSLQGYVGTFEWEDDDQVRMHRIETTDLQKPIPAQFVMNWFAARTDFLLANPWDVELKVCRHEDWFLACHWTPPGPSNPKPAPKIGYHPGVMIEHDKDIEPFDSAEYMALRSGRFQEHLRIMEAKWGLREKGLIVP